MGFLDDLGKNIGAVINPVQTVLGSVGLASPFAGALPGMSNPLNNNYQAQLAPITNPITDQQQTDATQGVGTALTGQQNLVNQLNGQNGLANQQNVYGQQQDLANILQQQAMGVGPNPAQAQLAQQTGNNVSQQASLMAGQRGAGANAGLIARQAGQQGAGIQQQAVGQAATLQAQQQLAAQQALMQQQQALQQTAAGQINNQIGAQNNLTNANLNNQGQVLGAQGQFNSSQVSNYGNQNSANASTAAGNANRNGQLLGGVLNGIGAALPLLNQGGQVPDHLAHVSNVYHDGKVPAMVSPGEKYLSPEEAQKVASGKKSISKAGETIKGKAQVKGDSIKNDTVKKDLESGGVVIPRSVMDNPKKAQQFLVDALAKHSKVEENDFHAALKKAISKRKAA